MITNLDGLVQRVKVVLGLVLLSVHANVNVVILTNAHLEEVVGTVRHMLLGVGHQLPLLNVLLIVLLGEVMNGALAMQAMQLLQGVMFDQLTAGNLHDIVRGLDRRKVAAILVVIGREAKLARDGDGRCLVCLHRFGSTGGRGDDRVISGGTAAHDC